jgi:hypothetical protein
MRLGSNFLGFISATSTSPDGQPVQAIIYVWVTSAL